MLDKTMVRILMAAGLIATMLVWTVTAGELVYDNGPPDGSGGGVSVSETDIWTSDSFTVINATALSGGVLGIDVLSPSSGTPATVGWSIGSSKFADDISAGVSSLTAISSTSYDKGYVFESSFPLVASLGPGTYWLSLNDMLNTDGSGYYWCTSDGPSQAWVGSVERSNRLTPSESFQLYGNPVPEPASLTLLGTALLGLGFVYLRRRGAKA